MKFLIILALLLCSLNTFGQNVSTEKVEQITVQQWNEEAKTNIRLLPKYGYAEKTPAQKKADEALIERSLKTDSTHRKASNHFVEIGFKYLYRDLKTAMYRFNQAYLLDSTNTDIYWGFAAVYMNLGEFEKAEDQYKQGLAIDPENGHLLTDYGTYYLTKYFYLEPLDRKEAETKLDSAISLLAKSYSCDPGYPSTSYKLSICYWIKNDCANSWKYYDICKSHGGQPITEDYTQDLMKKCKRP